MKKQKLCYHLFLCIALGTMIIPSVLAQESPQKFALVIGNGAYRNISRLNNPVNDANDMEAVLSELGFSVDKVLNGNLDEIENAIIQFRDRLSVTKNIYGFFFFAGHGVQSNGENYLIPVDANIQSEGNLRVRAVSVQAMLDDLNDAENELNIVVLDACRDNPFGWSRSGSRGLAIVGRQPADSIVVYATSVGSAAQDGDGKNGLFTSHLLNNIVTPGIDVNEVFRRTMGDVVRASENRQRPAIYSQFSEIAYLGSAPSVTDTVSEFSPVQPRPLPVLSGQQPYDKSLRYGFMNLALGLGSWVQGDKLGGAITTAGYAMAGGLFAYMNYSEPADRGLDTSGPLYPPIVIGTVALIGGTTIFGFVRPLVYSNKQRLASAMDKVDILLVSDEQNKTALRVGYTHSF